MRAKLTSTQLNKLKSAAKNKTGVILRIIKKNFWDEELPQKLFLTTRETTKIRNAIVRKMLTNINLHKAQLSKNIHSGEFLHNMLGNLGEKVITDLAIPLARDNLPELVSNLTSNAKNKFERKINGKGTVSAGKRFTLFILNEDMNDVIKIIKSLEDSNVLLDGITETVKHEIKNKKADFVLLCFVSNFSCFISGTSDFFSSKRYKRKRN